MAGLSGKIFFVLFIAVVLFVGASFVLARNPALYLNPAIPNPGHSIAQIEAPAGCSADQFLKLNSSGNAWECGTVGTGSSQWTTLGTSIYYNAGNVGIGINSPFTELAVHSSANVWNVSFGNVVSGGQNIRIGGNASGNGVIGTYLGTSGNVSSGNLILQRDGGNVGIGTTTPGEKLDVAGNLRVQGLIIGNSATGELALYGDQEASNALTISDAGNVSITGTLTTSGAITAQGGIVSSANISAIGNIDSLGTLTVGPGVPPAAKEKQFLANPITGYIQLPRRTTEPVECNSGNAGMTYFDTSEVVSSFDYAVTCTCNKQLGTWNWRATIQPASGGPILIVCS